MIQWKLNQVFSYWTRLSSYHQIQTRFYFFIWILIINIFIKINHIVWIFNDSLEIFWNTLELYAHICFLLINAFVYKDLLRIGVLYQYQVDGVLKSVKPFFYQFQDHLWWWELVFTNDNQIYLANLKCAFSYFHG